MAEVLCDDIVILSEDVYLFKTKLEARFEALDEDIVKGLSIKPALRKVNEYARGVEEDDDVAMG